MTDTILASAKRSFPFLLVVALACTEALLACGGGSPSAGVERASSDAATDTDVGSDSVVAVPSGDASSSDVATTPDSSGTAPTPDSGDTAVVDAGTEGSIEDAGSDSRPVDAQADAPAEAAPVCTSAQLLCAGTCLPIDANNCGACGTSCAGQTPVCSFVGGAFSCVSGCSGTEILCAGVCTDTSSSITNCGTCGDACSTGQTCETGHCACPTGETLCGSACIDTSTDDSNCGGCGSTHVCPSGDQCVNGSCLFIVSGHALDLTSTAPQPPPLAGCQVAVLDANGVRTQVTTDANGAFSVSGVTPPYDALVFVAPGSGPPVSLGSGPAAYLGLTTAHPRLLGPPAAVTSNFKSVTLNVPLALTACGATNCRYAIGASVEGGSTQLDGEALGGTYGAANLSQTASGSMGWIGSTSAALDVYVLASDEAGTHYWYGSAVGVAVTDQGTVTTPLITPVAVPILDTMTMTADMPNLPGWGAPTLVDIVLPSGWFTGLQEDTSATLSAAVPDIPGATLYLAVNSGVQGSGADAYATTPLNTTSETISVPAPPVLTSPLAGAQLSVANGQITWSGASPTEVQTVYFLYEPDGGETVEGAVWTSGSSVDLARLTTLGIALTGGPTTIALVGRGKVTSLNDMVDEQTLASPDDTEANGVEQSFTLAP